MESNPLIRLSALGQSVWLDFIRRDMLENGDLERMIKNDGLRGMTSNPSIFAQAVSNKHLYDADIRQAPAKSSPQDVFETLAVKDIQKACDHFKPVYESTRKKDGYVSIEVSPKLARDTKGTTDEARRLWKACARQNVMIKIPGTAEGLPAIETCLAEGININVTLLFGVARYEEVIDSWLRALEKRAQQGQPIDGIASVASFFVSRVDTAVDAAIDARLKTAEQKLADRLEDLKSRLGIANARLAYQSFVEKVARSDRFAALAKKGAMPQRPLWASTSTKNPLLPDVYYVEALIGEDTVDTVPPATFDAYRDHGKPAARVEDDLASAKAALSVLKTAGIDFAAITQQLEVEGVKKFSDSYDELIETVAAKRAAIAKA